MLSRSALPLLALFALAACENPTAPSSTIAGGRAHRVECVTREITEDCDRTPAGPVYSLAGGWQLSTVNGYAVTDYWMRQGYSFRASASDPYNVRFVAVGGFMCVSPSLSFSLLRQVWAFWDKSPLEEAPGYGGYLTTTGSAPSYLGSETWDLGSGLTATRYAGLLTVTFGYEGSPVYTFVDAGPVGVQNCAASGYSLTPANLRGFTAR